MQLLALGIGLAQIVKKFKKNMKQKWIQFFKNLRIKKKNSYRDKLCQGEKMTWGNNGCFSRIDRFYVSEGLWDTMQYTNIFETTKSDNKAVFANFEYSKKEKI